MQGYKIDVFNQCITLIEIPFNEVLKTLRKEIDCDIVDCYHAHNVDFWIDDESLLKTPQAPTFVIKDHAIITGNAIVLGHDGGGKTVGAPIKLDILKELITFTGEVHREPMFHIL